MRTCTAPVINLINTNGVSRYSEYDDYSLTRFISKIKHFSISIDYLSRRVDNPDEIKMPMRDYMIIGRDNKQQCS
ncbi:MAG: hypothetical protein NC489_27155 [Ruminococcus flavefaciens]|nr:hypothetical protein [Ruminococcus flavefaciens]